MAKIIIGIHGLANKPPSTEEKAGWKQALEEGLLKNHNYTEPFTFDMVYWADLLYKYPLHLDPNFTFDKLYNREPYIPAKELKIHSETLIDRTISFTLGVGGKLLDMVNPDRNGNWLLNKTLKDLGFYYDPDRILTKNKTTDSARKILDNTLKDKLLQYKNREIMLISHSMGTIISYNVLRDLGQENNRMFIPYFVTLGSPLGLPYVKGKIKQERSYDPIVRTPTLVSKSWKNFADRKDPVAVDVKLKDDYKENSLGVRVEDDLIWNDYPGNHHKVFGYLRCPEVSGWVHKFLSSA